MDCALYGEIDIYPPEPWCTSDVYVAFDQFCNQY